MANGPSLAAVIPAQAGIQTPSRLSLGPGACRVARYGVGRNDFSRSGTLTIPPPTSRPAYTYFRRRRPAKRRASAGARTRLRPVRSDAHDDNTLPAGAQAEFGWITALARNFNVGPSMLRKRIFIDDHLRVREDFDNGLVQRV